MRPLPIAIEETIFHYFDAIGFDLDETILTCYTPEGDQFGAFELVPPFHLLRRGFLRDANKNICIVHDGVYELLSFLKENGKKLYIVTRSADPSKVTEAQPALMALRKLELDTFFDEIHFAHRLSSKADYLPTEGKVLFIDNDLREILLIKEERPEVYCILRESFEDFYPISFRISKKKGQKFREIDLDNEYERVKGKLDSKTFGEIYRKILDKRSVDNDEDEFLPTNYPF